MYRPLALFFLPLLLSVSAAVAAQSGAPAASPPLPNAAELLQRALANERKLAAEQERYECRVMDTTVETDSRGSARKTTTEVSDRFYVNGIPIERTLQKNGRDLTPEETKKEDERVMKETLKYANPAAAKKEIDKQHQAAGDLIEAMMLARGHREVMNGRSVLFFDILPNPRFEAKNFNQRVAQVMQGSVSIDEQTGTVMDLNVKSVADLKIGGGLVANVHKGFWFHAHNHPEPDGIWLTDLAEGSGDARAALFLHPYLRFKETTDSCHLYSATAIQVGKPEVRKPN